MSWWWWHVIDSSWVHWVNWWGWHGIAWWLHVHVHRGVWTLTWGWNWGACWSHHDWLLSISWSHVGVSWLSVVVDWGGVHWLLELGIWILSWDSGVSWSTNWDWLSIRWLWWGILVGHDNIDLIGVSVVVAALGISSSCLLSCHLLHAHSSGSDDAHDDAANNEEPGD